MPPRLILALLVQAAVSPAQMVELPVVSVPVALSSGPMTNSGSATQVVWSDSVNLAWAGSLQAVFAGIELNDPEDAVLVTSVAGGETQVLDRAALPVWTFGAAFHASAWLNGSSVVIGLRLAAGSSGRVDLDHIRAGMPPTPGPDDFCGPDDRVASADNRAFRLIVNFPGSIGICTGWLIGSNSTFLTAGHCWTGSPASAEGQFNVPASTAAGQIVYPSLSNRFGVTMSTVSSVDGGVGNDWGVARLSTNNVGQNAATLFGFYTLAQTMPATGITLRATGFGADTTPLTATHTNQTSTGAFTFLNVTEIDHLVDSQGGLSGGPLLNDSNSQAIGIHTHGGCASVGSNAGTSILHTNLQHAIAQSSPCAASIPLTGGAAQTMSCTPVQWTLLPTAGQWNGVIVSSATSDWDCTIGTQSSVFGGTAADFVLANGHLGAISVPALGSFTRWSGAGSATGQSPAAQTLTIGTALVSSWDATRVGRLFQFNVTAAGLHQVNISGDTTISWVIHSPGTNASWRTRSAPTQVASGNAGASTLNVNLATGWHALVVFRNTGAASPNPSSLVVSVCPNTAATALVSGGAPATVTTACQPFTTSTSAGNWNVAGISSASDWNTQIGPASSATAGAACDFAVANGKLGFIFTVSGIFTRASGTDSAVAELPATSTLTIGIPSSQSLSAGRILKAWQFQVTAAGNHDLTVTADAALGWSLFAPGTNSTWRGRSASIATGNGAGGTQTLSLAAGWHALVVHRDGGGAPVAMPVTASVCASTAVLALVQGAPLSMVSGSCRPFSFTRAAGAWNGVGVTSTPDWNLSIGSMESVQTGALCDFLVYNGHAGVATPASGLFTRASGAANGQVQHAATEVLTKNVILSPFFGSGDILRLFEFDVAAAGTYSLTTTGPAGLGYAVFAPGAAGWRARSAAAATGTVGAAASNHVLGTGWHVLAVFRDGGTAVSGGLTLEVSLANPAPGLTSISPSPVAAGGPAFTMTLDGSDFTPASVVHADGAPLATTFVSATQLTASVPASLIATVGTTSITVVTPLPGGGTSGALPLDRYGPRITGVTPAGIVVMTPASPPAPITIDGTGFVPASVVWAYNAALATGFVSATQLTATLPATAPQTQEEGGIGLVVRNFAAVQSNTLGLRVGSGSNAGTVHRTPADPQPGETFTLQIEGAAPFQLFTVMVDVLNPPPLTGLPTPAINLVWHSYSLAMFTFVDGIGIFGPTDGSTLFSDPSGTPPGGVFFLPGLPEPNPPINLPFTIQSVYLDPAAPAGFRITWARRFNDL